LSSSLKRKITIAIVAFAAVALAGGAYAATQHSGATSRQAFLNDVAKRLNVTPQQLRSALQGAYLDRLAAEVAAGRLTQAQASAIKKQVLQSGSLAPGPGLGGFVPAYRFGGRLGPDGLGAYGFAMFGGVGGELGAAATYLGTTTSKLISDLRSGKTLAQIAATQGKTTGGLESAMTATIKARLDKAVASKMITSAQERKLLSHLSSMLSAIVSRPALGRGQIKPGFRGALRFFYRPPAGAWNRGGASGGRAHGGSWVPLYGGGPPPAGLSGAAPPAAP
jgi:hypothetical protein